MFEILKYAPLHNWSAYEGALQNNPVLAKMMISGIVYSIGDWFAQVKAERGYIERSLSLIVAKKPNVPLALAVL